MWAVLFAISWAGFLFILGGIWLLVVLVRGFFDFVSWLYEVVVVEPRERREREELRRQRRRQAREDGEEEAQARATR